MHLLQVARFCSDGNGKSQLRCNAKHCLRCARKIEESCAIAPLSIPRLPARGFISHQRGQHVFQRVFPRSILFTLLVPPPCIVPIGIFARLISLLAPPHMCLRYNLTIKVHRSAWPIVQTHSDAPDNEVAAMRRKSNRLIGARGNIRRS